MKPLEDLSCSEVQAGDLVWEMQSNEFFYHIGMLVMEGRTPQQSDKGRVEGPHCLLLSEHIGHICDLKENKDKFVVGSVTFLDDKCIQAVERKKQMELLWQQNSLMCIEVCIHTSEKHSTPLLLEQWKIELLHGIGNVSTSDSILMQAIRSHIHFSQLSAWLSTSRGMFPAHVSYKLYQSNDEPMGDFMVKPEKHTFPLASLPNSAALYVTVLSLPRAGTQDMPKEPETLRQWYLTGEEHAQDIGVNGCERKSHIFDDRSPLKKRPCGNHDDRQNKPVDNLKCLVAKLPSFSLQPSNSETGNTKDNMSATNGKLPETSGVQLGTPEHELASVKADYRIYRSFSDDQQLFRGLYPSHIKLEDKKSCHQSSQEEKTFPYNLQEKETSPSVHIPTLPLDGAPCKTAYRRLSHMDACTIPVFHPKTALPVSSSPAPLRRPTTELDYEDHNLMDGLSCRPDAQSHMLSKSAPASTKQSLLGNFEESVLNGRMEPLGTVQGFSAELGASGSFCPSHITLPITAYFFRLSDDDAPSPYLGYINLDQPTICRKGYHIPRKGTVQLTVFNPSKTVVKMFVVSYSFTDMPPRSQTFLRQKMFSAPVDSPNEESQACLHYLIHLRFASSTSGRIYLHTDIRVIFAQQPPDLSSRFRVWTVTNGPTDPEYTPRKDGHTCRHAKDASTVDCKIDLRNHTDGCEHMQFTQRTEKRTCRHTKDASTVDCEIELQNSTDGCGH